MSKGLMLIDESNWGFAATATKRLSVGEQDTHAVFGFIRRLRDMVRQYPILEPIVLADGISWRYDAFAEYKGSRDKTPTTKNEIEQAEIRKSFRSQKRLIGEALKLLGVRRMAALNWEADDLAAFLVKRYAGKKRIMLLSGDKDWIQLVREGVTWMDLINDRRLGAKSFATQSATTEKIGIGFVRNGEWIGLKRPEQWADAKCLMGDKSDEIEGVGGIGAVGAIELLAQWGSVENFCNSVIDKTIDINKLPKKLADFASSEEKMIRFARNKMLMDLESPKIPAANGLTLTSPTFDRDGFETFCREWMFDSILTSFDTWVEPFERM